MTGNTQYAQIVISVANCQAGQHVYITLVGALPLGQSATWSMGAPSNPQANSLQMQMTAGGMVPLDSLRITANTIDVQTSYSSNGGSCDFSLALYVTASPATTAIVLNATLPPNISATVNFAGTPPIALGTDTTVSLF
jgi:hypothetical protein